MGRWVREKRGDFSQSLPSSPVFPVLRDQVCLRISGTRGKKVVEDARGGGIAVGEAVPDAVGVWGKLKVGEVEAWRDSAAHEGIRRPRAGHGPEPAAAGHDMDKLFSGGNVLPQQAVLSAAVRMDDRQAQGAAQQEMPYLVGMQPMQAGAFACAQQKEDGGAPRPFAAIAGGQGLRGDAAVAAPDAPVAAAFGMRLQAIAGHKLVAGGDIRRFAYVFLLVPTRIQGCGQGPMSFFLASRLACVRGGGLEARPPGSNSGKSFGGEKGARGKRGDFFKSLPSSPGVLNRYAAVVRLQACQAGAARR